jgi:hypothetical protein
MVRTIRELKKRVEELETPKAGTNA